MDQRESDQRWFSLKPTEGVQFGLNDSVQITAGKHCGEGGAVISLLSVSPVIYLVELGSGRGVEVAEFDLELIEKHIKITSI
jgi:hypothetical protein